MNYDLSAILVSYNTCELLRKCLHSLKENTQELKIQIILVDNASKDGSIEMVREEFPDVIILPSTINLGFGTANNLGFLFSIAPYVLLLNTDAFLQGNALKNALMHIKSTPNIGLGGAKLVGRDGLFQPSKRRFPNPWYDFLLYSGLSHFFPSSSLFGRVDYVNEPIDQSRSVDWLPGAFCLIPRSVILEVGFFDERFFLYYEEVDLCHRIKNAGYEIWYWPDVEVIHYGGESSKTVKNVAFSDSSSQLTLWNFRSEYQYYTKNHSQWISSLSKLMINSWHRLRALKNKNNSEKSKESLRIVELSQRAWQETNGGKICPPKPW